MRRRLFPMTPAQQLPGRRVEIEGVLQPVAAADVPAADIPAGGCDVTGVMWVAHPSLREYRWADEVWYERGFPHVGVSEQVGDSITDSGDAAFIYVSPPYFYSYGEESDRPPPALYAGVALGPQTRNVQWSAERSGSLFPITVDTNGPVALVTLTPFQIDDGPDWFTFENVTLTARCGDGVVGMLRMQIRLDGW